MRQIFTIVLIIFCSNLYAQKFDFHGIVYTSGSDTSGLSNATVQVLGTNITTKTQSEGHFSFKTDLTEGKLKVGFLGFKTKEVSFSSKIDSPIIVYLDADNNSLEEVQVIGYGQTTKRFNTGSVTTISAKEIEQQPVTNVLSALSGRMTGVYVQTTNGLPGGNINIQIRGTGSIQAGTNPLYIIDGVPYDGEAVGQGSTISAKSVVGSINPLNILNPNDIENISVLKDADATAIYGSRGSNGVVLITTKKGKSGQTRFNLSLNQGFSKITESPKLLSLEEYLELRKEAFSNDGRTPSADPSSADYAPDLTVWSQTGGTNWYEEIYGNSSKVTNGQLSVSGGNSHTNFNISGNFRSEGSILRGMNKYIKSGLQSNISHLSKNDRFKINLSAIYNRDKTDISNPANNINMVFLLPPNYPVFDEDGSYNWYAGTNLEAEMLSRGYSTTNNLLGNLFTTYKIPIGLELKVSGGYSHRSSNQDQIFPAESLFPGTTNNTMFGQNSVSSFIIEPQAEYKKDFSNSKLVALIGGTYQSRTTESMYLNASNFPNEAIMRNLGSAGTIDGKSNSFIEYKYVSAFGRLIYNLLDRYIINATVRRDGSSRFGPANRFGNFYSIGGAWIVSEETWFSKLDEVLSFAKLRVSYGQTGNDQISDYQYLSTYQANGSNTYGGIGVLKPSRVFNSQFHWEVTKKLELAMELGFLKDRLFLTVNHYVNRSANQLVSYPLPRITGFSSYQANLPAVVQNTGWEFDLNARLMEKENFRWRITANVTLPKNKLVKFDNIENSSYANTHRIGYDITRTYGYNFVGVDKETGLALYTDQDGVISDNPYRFHTLGKGTPDFYGGIGNELSYKNFQLSIFGQFAQQSHFGNLTFNQFGFQTLNGYKLLANRWMSIGDDTGIPKVSSEYRDDISYFGDSNGNYYSVPYFRLKSLSLAYTLPNQIAEKLRCRSLGLSVSAQNLFTLWDNTIPILDPEAGGSVGAIATIAPVRSVMFGINLSL